MEKTGKILIVDDNEDVLFALNLLLEPHVEKIKVTTLPEKIDFHMQAFRPDIVLLDMNFSRDAISGEEGFECLHRILETDPETVVIFMTAYSDTEKAVRAIKAGATDFISKPWEKEKLIATIRSAIKLRQSRREVRQLQARITALSDASEEVPCMVGRSLAMLGIMETIQQLADTDANILILGENGTGKDVVARTLRHFSPRKEQPFVTVDAGSIPESLFESELFGHCKGAFTGAQKDRAGRMEAAHGGTLFLDEIGNLSLPMQAKLLTALERRVISRLGSTEEIPVDVRLICATNADIRREVENRNFRQDLYYHINTIEIRIPPLRERGEDILLLAEYFLDRYNHKYKKNIATINREARQKLMRYPWPGNVRELQHAIERAVILSGSKTLGPQNFVLETPTADSSRAQDLIAETLNLEKLEQKAIAQAMKRSEGNLTKAAEYLGITRYSLYRKLEKIDLS